MDCVSHGNRHGVTLYDVVEEEIFDVIPRATHDTNIYVLVLRSRARKHAQDPHAAALPVSVIPIPPPLSADPFGFTY